jgi:hypothetical protein
MLVDIGEDQFSVIWHHNAVAKHPDPSTSCEINRISKDSVEHVYTGYSYTSKKDSFDKNKGRKISLARALVVRVPDPKNSLQKIPLFDKTSRKLFWDGYYYMRNEKF